MLHILCFYGKLTLTSIPNLATTNWVLCWFCLPPPTLARGLWKTDDAPASSVHLDLLLPVFKHHLAPCLSRKNVHWAYALCCWFLVSIWQLRGSYGSYESWCHIALICAFRFLILMSSLSLFYFAMLECASTLCFSLP